MTSRVQLDVNLYGADLDLAEVGRAMSDVLDSVIGRGGVRRAAFHVESHDGDAGVELVEAQTQAEAAESSGIEHDGFSLARIASA